MNTFFVSTLSTQQLCDVMSLYSQTEVVSIEQYPGYGQIIEPDISLKYLLAYRENKFAGYACVKIKKKLLASVYFGPLVKIPEDFEEVCDAIVSSCAHKGILILKILPPYIAPEMSDTIRSFSRFKFERSEDQFNWATLKLRLDKPLEDILKGFSDNHRQSIKKAQKLNLTTEVITEPSEIDIFTSQYINMYQARGLPISPHLITKTFKLLFEFYRKHNAGFFLVVRSPADGIIGGVCISYQGDSGFYQKGYSHPDHRNLPISHLAVYEAIKLCKENGLKVFDFGGYGLNLKEGDQVNSINRFKAWFGGQLVHYPQTLTIYTTPFSKFIYGLYLRLKKAPE